MRKKFKIHIACDDANIICDKTQYKEASLWEKIKLNLHLIYCKACRKYTKRNKALTKAIKESEVVCIDEAYKKDMKARFEEALKQQ